MLRKKQERYKALIRAFFNTPSRIPVFGFLMIIILGALLLKTPWALKAGKLSWTDAFFTSTSASCITGLSVIDISTNLTPFGLGIILALIQIGGLGIMTFSTLVLIAIKRRPKIRDKNIISDIFSYKAGQNPKRIINDVIKLTLSIEALGALALFLRFSWDMPLGQAFIHAIFHSISAFCNAGISIFPNGLLNYQKDFFVNLTIISLVLIGGFGFLALTEIKDTILKKDKRFSRLSLHTKLISSLTLIFFLSAALLFFIFEYQNTIKDINLKESLIAAFFHSACLRTAGFSIINFNDMTSITLFSALIFMFIGANPGSCGGGIKTTTIATLFLLGIARLKGKEKPEIFSRSIPEASITRAMSIFLVSLFAISFAIMALLISETHALPYAESKDLFFKIVFEAISAFSTTGISIGLSSALSTIGKWIVILLMFTGRLGPLMLAVAISRGRDVRFSYAEENIMIG